MGVSVGKLKNYKMTYPTKPGQRCKIIGGRTLFNQEGPSPNFGKIVVTTYLHKEQAGIELENVWHCTAEVGVLATYYGVGAEADFLECWLEVLPPEVVAPKTLETSVGEPSCK